MDKDADGVVDFAEIQAYEKYKKDLLTAANAEEAARMAAKAKLQAERDMAAEAAKVGVQRDFNGNHIVSFNYATEMTKAQFAEVDAAGSSEVIVHEDGPFASFLHNSKPVVKEPEKPRGRWHTTSGQPGTM